MPSQSVRLNQTRLIAGQYVKTRRSPRAAARKSHGVRPRTIVRPRGTRGRAPPVPRIAPRNRRDETAGERTAGAPAGAPPGDVIDMLLPSLGQPASDWTASPH